MLNMPHIINYILTLRYPGSTSDRMDWVCYRSGFQIIIPFFPPRTTINFTIEPLNGVYAWLGYALTLGSDLVPNAFSTSLTQYGTLPFTGVVTRVFEDGPIPVYIFVTAQEPSYVTITNRSSMGQRFELNGSHIVIPSPDDLKVVMEGLRRLETSRESEQLLQQAVILLGKLAKEEVKPLPAIGEIE